MMRRLIVCLLLVLAALPATSLTEAPVAEEESDSALFSSIPVSLLGVGQANLEFTIDGETSQPFTHFGVRTTPGNPDFIRKGYPVIELIATSDSGHPPWRLLLILDGVEEADDLKRVTAPAASRSI